MAEDDPYDYAFGQFPDVNPPGTMTSLGLKPDDPLNEWGRNIKPADLAQYVHDPQGFMNNMANQGVPPPDHHYTRGLNGDLQAYDPATGQPVRMTGGKIQGNLSDYLNPPAGKTAAQAVAPPAPPGGTSRALGFTDPITGVEVPGTPPDAEIRAGGSTGGFFNIPSDAPIRQPGQILGPRDASTKPKLVNPHPFPPADPNNPDDPNAPLPRRVLLPMDDPRRVAPAELPPVPEQEAQPGSTPAERAREKKDKVEPLSGEAMTNFAKSLQGVKMPQRPAWQPMGAPAVRSPVGIQPQIQGLLAAIGQGRPSPQQVALMRLLGRA